MTDCVIFDIRQLQKDLLLYSPLDRSFLSILNGTPESIFFGKDVKFFADRARVIPDALLFLSDRIIYSPPYRNETVLVVELPSSETGLRDLMRSPVADMAQTITISDECREGDGGAVVESYQFLTFRMRAASGGSETDETVGMAVPVILDSSLSTPPNELEEIELNALFSGTEPVLAIDGALAAKKDVMRAVLGLIRRNPARILVCGDYAAVEAPEVTVLRAGPALMAQIVTRALAVLTPSQGGAEAFSMAEVALLGGRCIAVKDTLDIHDLGELGALPAGLSGTPRKPDYEALWTHILAKLPVAVASAVPDRPRIALVTTMFPQKGGPPHSSLDLALALAEIADVDIWTDADMLPAHRARVNAVFRLDSPFESSRYDGIVYVLGNHPMYLKIFDMMRVHGGTLILHDAHMLDFLKHCYGEKRLETLLFKEEGRAINVANLGKVINELASYGRPFLQEIVRHANPTIVHSPTSAALLRDLYGTDAHYFPVAMPYTYTQAELKSDVRLQAKLALGISPSRPCIASFGEVHMMKGAKQCLFVMKELLDWGVDFQFLFVGPVEKSLSGEMKDRIYQYGLQDNIVIKGAVSESDYIQHLQAVDMVLQIRQIPFGQVSGALLDAVSAGMHGVASENLARSIEAPAMIRRVKDKASPTIYAEQLAEMIETKCYEDRPGPGWEEFTVKHDFARYARNLLALLFGNRR